MKTKNKTPQLRLPSHKVKIAKKRTRLQSRHG